MAYDKSFMVVLSRMREQAVDNIQRNTPCIDRKGLDGELRGYLYAIEAIIKAYTSHE